MVAGRPLCATAIPRRHPKVRDRQAGDGFAIGAGERRTGLARLFTARYRFIRSDGLAGESGQCRERRGLEGQQLVVAGLLHLARPGRVDQQRATDRDQIELVALQPVEQVVDPGGLGRFAVQRADGVAGQRDAADGDGGFAGKLLGPAGEVQVGALEFRLPEATLGAVEDIDAGGR